MPDLENSRPSPNDPPADSAVRFRVRRAVRAIGATGLLALSGAWMLGDRAMIPDLIANLGAQLAILSLALALWWGVRRAWRCALIGALAALLHGAALSDRRAAIGGGEPGFSVLTYNPNNANRAHEEAAAVILGSHAALVGLVEPPVELILALEGGGPIPAAYPHMVFRAWTPGATNSYQALLSRWPIERPDRRPNDESFAGVIDVIVRSPHGPLGVVLLHPPSARTGERWREGNEEIRAAARAARRFSDAGLPVVVLGDLNSTPSGWRSRHLVRAGGVRRTTPRWPPRGTYPASWPWPFSLSIDDVLVSSGVRVSSWRMLGAGGSDHRPVLVGVSVGSSSSGPPR